MNYRKFNQYLKSLYITKFKDRQEILKLFKNGIKVNKARKLIEEDLGYSEITSDNVLEYIIFPQKRLELDKKVERGKNENK